MKQLLKALADAEREARNMEQFNHAIIEKYGCDFNQLREEMLCEHAGKINIFRPSPNDPLTCKDCFNCLSCCTCTDRGKRSAL